MKVKLHVTTHSSHNFNPVLIKNAANSLQYSPFKIDQFTVVCLATWPMKTSEADSELALIQTSLLFSFKYQLVSTRT